MLIHSSTVSSHEPTFWQSRREPTGMDNAVMGVDHSFWEKCARHTSSYTARNVAYFFLCDGCCSRFTHEVFNERPAIYHGDSMQGFCGLCNELTDVRFRQWFLCPICYNVASSYQKGFVSAAAVHEFWRRHVVPVVPSLTLRETDVVTLSPFARGKRTKRQAADDLADADFLVSEKTADGEVPRFHIELKAGPGAMDAMSEFQLDMNDYNDIVGPVLNTGLPAYVFHVQLGMEYFPPTKRSVSRNLWWTDLATLTSHLKRRARRRDESKPAFYFEPKAFRDKSDFVEHVAQRGYERVISALKAAPPELAG